ncbi:MAG: M6 family metalloprotease domain-containing protein [Prevotella sp.]|nr:M6 family metalloprotease domain-containing protein [Prevotella sp.]
MKRIMLLALVLMLTVVNGWAVPARPGLWKTIVTPQGEKLSVQLCGDERGCFWLSNDGRRFVEKADGSYQQASLQELAAARSKSRLQSSQSAKLPISQSSRPHLKGSQPVVEFLGQKKGLIILAEFQNKHFLPEHDRAYFERVANERGFSEGDYRGSVKDYFLSQSDSLFELDFDVVGPVTVSKNYEYYGQPGAADVDAHPWEMVVEACELVADQVHFADYDWNGDGFVEQVFVLYAGQGQSDSYDVNTIWPHEYELHQIVENGIHVYGKGHEMPDGLIIDTYACSNELTSQDGPSGIGTICHEFSHCMGLPDLYDVDYNGNFGMGHWSLMANGVYNGRAFIPAGYTSYERMACGWRQPVELCKDTLVSDMKAVSDGGDTYIVYNEAYPDEYYLLENRQPTGWDAALPSAGLLVLHVDYDERVWRENIVNSVCDYRQGGNPDMWNTHQRLTLIHADNDNDKRYWMPTYQSYTKTTEETDTYPYWSMVNDEWSMVNDSLTNNSIPVASVYHGNTDNSLFMNHGIQKITQLDNGSISFRFDELSVKYVAVDTTMTDKPDLTGAIFYESFDRCIGTGGNDGVFKGSSDVASADFLPDNGGWDSMVMKGGARCAKFGNATYDGIVSSPFILLTGDSLLLSFKAAPWSRDDTSLSVSATGDAKFETSEFEMTEGQWTTFSTVLTGQGNIQITFTPGRRFFLDEVVVKRLPENYAEGVSHQEVAFKPNVSYDLSGRQLEDGKLKRGVYLIRKSDGSFRKVITRE